MASARASIPMTVGVGLRASTPGLFHLVRVPGPVLTTPGLFHSIIERFSAARRGPAAAAIATLASSDSGCLRQLVLRRQVRFDARCSAITEPDLCDAKVFFLVEKIEMDRWIGWMDGWIGWMDRMDFY